MKKIVIRAVDKPVYKNPDELIEWFCEAFGLSSGNDKNSLEAEILKKFILAASRNSGISSSQITLKPKVARSTVIYHLNRFIETGLVVKRGRKYYLRAQELSTSIEEIEYDINREMMRMLDTAREFERIFEMQHKKGKKIEIE